jgi:hypothetical protein
VLTWGLRFPRRFLDRFDCLFRAVACPGACPSTLILVWGIILAVASAAAWASSGSTLVYEVAGGGDGGVPEHVLDDFHLDPGCEGDGGAVAEVVQPDRRQSCLPGQRRYVFPNATADALATCGPPLETGTRPGPGLRCSRCAHVSGKPEPESSLATLPRSGQPQYLQEPSGSAPDRCHRPESPDTETRRHAPTRKRSCDRYPMHELRSAGREPLAARLFRSRSCQNEPVVCPSWTSPVRDLVAEIGEPAGRDLVATGVEVDTDVVASQYSGCDTSRSRPGERIQHHRARPSTGGDTPQGQLNRPGGDMPGG